MKLRLLILLIAVATSFASCTKEGKGGNASISGVIKRNGVYTIPNSVVYIKYGTTEFPGEDPQMYDDSYATGTEATFEFTELKKGDYYLFVTGFDVTGGFSVSGGMVVNLERKQHKALDPFIVN